MFSSINVVVHLNSVCNLLHVKVGYTNPYHPQGSSVSEEMHSIMITGLNLLCFGNLCHWSMYLVETQSVFNSTIHKTLGKQLQFALFLRRAHSNNPSSLHVSEGDVNDGVIEKAHLIIQLFMRKDKNLIAGR